jgi:hypothetical protein
MGASLTRANLDGANLMGASLTRASLDGANLDRANLMGANLYGANLMGANLYGANLMGANLMGANLPDDFPIHRFSIVPESGAFEAYKKVYGKTGAVILKLLIPKDAKRLGGLVGRKCRASKARVLKAYTKEKEEFFYSSHDREFLYKVGKTVKVDDFCDDPKQECAPGIHFFMTKKEAEEYF